MKNAIVTGATRGIGLATAEMLLKEGYFVTVTYAYDEPSVEPCKARLSAVSDSFEIVWADQTNKQEMRDFAAKMREKGHIDCLVCNAGMTLRTGLSEIVEEDWERVMQMNVTFCCWLSLASPSNVTTRPSEQVLWLLLFRSFMMKKLNPKSMAKMPYILPESSHAITSPTVWSHASVCTIGSFVKISKCSTE